MKITTGTKDGKPVFVAISKYEEKDLVKEAGFRWDPEAKRWWTGDPVIASKLEEVADESAKAAIAAGQKQVEASQRASADLDIPRPDGLEYLPFQRAGIAYAMERDAVLIGDCMGLGKTIEAVGVLNATPPDHLRHVLVICPASLKINWKRETEKWLVHDLPVRIVNGAGVGPGVNIINYDVLGKYPAIKEIEWDVLIADECHYLRNPKTLRSQHVYGSRKKDKDQIAPIRARRKLFLTGTPIVNKPVELFPIIHYLRPDEFGSWYQYVKRYCDGAETRHGWDVSGASNLDELQLRLRTHLMVRRLKEDVLKELPPKIRQVVEIPANGCEGTVRREREAWGAVQERLETLRVNAELAKAGSAEDYRAAVDALRDGARAAFEEVARVRHETAVAKVPYVIEHLKEALEEHDKMVVFAHHHDVIDAIHAAFPDSVVLTGRDSQTARQSAVDRFQGDPAVRLFIGSIQAAGVGLTLTAASHVVFAELDWVPGNVSQSEDRLHRIGQVDSVLVQHLVLEDSIDAHIAKTLVAKQAVIDTALDTTPDLQRTPILPIPEAETAGVSRKKIEAEAESLTPDQCRAIHQALRTVAGMCDGAYQRDNIGFNSADTRIGKSLALQDDLTPRQAALGRRIVLKYKKQYPDSLFDLIADRA